jgi:hypothetical protein
MKDPARAGFEPGCFTSAEILTSPTDHPTNNTWLPTLIALYALSSQWLVPKARTDYSLPEVIDYSASLIGGLVQERPACAAPAANFSEAAFKAHRVHAFPDWNLSPSLKR